MSDATSIFSRIVAGEIPCHKVYEDDRVLAFLDIGPLADGHLLVIPKHPYVTIDEMPPDDLAAIARVLPRLARALLAVTGAEGYNLLQNNGTAAGQVVMHVHFHLIPRRAGDGLGYRWNASSYPAGRAEQLRERFIQTLED